MTTSFPNACWGCGAIGGACEWIWGGGFPMGGAGCTWRILPGLVGVIGDEDCCSARFGLRIGVICGITCWLGCGGADAGGGGCNWDSLCCGLRIGDICGIVGWLGGGGCGGAEGFGCFEDGGSGDLLVPKMT